MSKSQDLSNESDVRISNPLLTFDPTTFEAWVMVPQAEVDRLGITNDELVDILVKKYGKNINICIGQPVIFNKDDY